MVTTKCPRSNVTSRNWPKLSLRTKSRRHCMIWSTQDFDNSANSQIMPSASLLRVDSKCPNWPGLDDRVRLFSCLSSCCRIVVGLGILSFLVGFIVLRLWSSGSFQGGPGVDEYD